MLSDILKYISSNSEILKDKDNAYNYFYELFKGKFLLDLKFNDIEKVINELFNSIEYLFIYCASKGNIDLFKYLATLYKGDPKILDGIIHYNDEAAFKIAAYNGHVHIMKYLVDLTIDKQDVDFMVVPSLEEGEEDIFSAASKNGHIEVLKYLVELSDDDESVMELFSYADYLPFIYAIISGRLEIVKFLLELGSKYNVKDEMIHIFNDYPFILASNYGYIDILKILIENTPDAEKCMDMIHANQYEAFKVSFENSSNDVTKYLINLSKYFNDVNNKESCDVEILKLAIIYDNLPIMKYLLEFTNNEFQKDNMTYGDNDLHFKIAIKYHSFNVIKYMLGITKQISKKIEMIHVNDDELFYVCSLKKELDLFKYLSIYDPFNVPELRQGYILYTEYMFYMPTDFRNIDIEVKNYANINIRYLKNISNCNKNLFSLDNSSLKLDNTNFSLTDLPLDLLYLVTIHLCEAHEDDLNKVKSAINAFKYNNNNYEGGFSGFTIRYENNLKELSGDIDIDQEVLEV